FWFGGIAAGSSFVALACDLAGDEQSAAVARKVALGALGPSPVLLILDLGRPERFVNMLRIFKPRSPMSMGAWALTLFGNLAAGAVGADLLGRRRLAQRLGAANAVVGGYLGSYTGVLLAATAVPVWARSRLFLGPIFVSTAAATGAAACRLALVADGLPVGHPTRRALGTVETAAMAAELGLSILNEKRLGELASGLETGRPGALFKFAKWSVRVGLSLRFARSRGPWVHHVASVLYLAAGLMFRYAWVGAGRHSARHDDVVAKMARESRRGS
ncbi:MAG TPA: NrfD/PsrC family molybdoenzyme membrane anchor subunit, partial [Planctomycetota bacterium]|nr:NrfD/PsrC family molybdoenzyme membrane anchor subunit [Planctomycetota bacterium]